MVPLNGFVGTAYIAFVKKHTQMGLATEGDRWILDNVEIGPFNGITGNVKYSIGADCSSNAYVVKNARMAINDADGTQIVFTNHLGNYAGPSEHLYGSVAPNFSNAPLFNMTPPSHSFNLPDFGNIVTADFCLTTNIAKPDLQAYIMSTPFKPGGNSMKKVIYRNIGSEPASGTVSVTFPINHFHIDGTSNYTVTGNTVNWNYSDLMPFESRTMDLYFTTNEPTNPEFPINEGDAFLLTALITPVTGRLFSTR